MNIFKKKQEPYKRVELGGGAFIADFYVDEKHPDLEHNYLRIYAPSNVFEQRVVGHPMGYLLAAVEQGKESELLNYCIMLWVISQEVYQDIRFCKDLVKAINAHEERRTKLAKEKAAEVTETAEMAQQAFMEEVVEEAEMPKKQRKAKRKANRKEIKEILTESE